MAPRQQAGALVRTIHCSVCLSRSCNMTSRRWTPAATRLTATVACSAHHEHLSPASKGLRGTALDFFSTSLSDDVRSRRLASGLQFDGLLEDTQAQV